MDPYVERVLKLPALLSVGEYCAAHPLLNIVSDKVCYPWLIGFWKGACKMLMLLNMTSACL